MLSLAVLMIIFVVVAANTIVAVPAESEFIVERMGKFKRVLKPGLNLLLIPFADRVVRRFSVKPSVLAIPVITTPNKEMLPITVVSDLSYQVIDSEQVYQNLENLEEALASSCHTVIRTGIQDYTLDEILLERKRFEDVVTRRMKDTVRNRGIKIIGFSVQSTTPPDEVIRAMEERARREKSRRQLEQ